MKKIIALIILMLFLNACQAPATKEDVKSTNNTDNTTQITGTDTAAERTESAKPAEPVRIAKKGLMQDARMIGGMGLMAESDTIDNFNRDQYDHIQENDFKSVKDAPLSTFSADVDTASYSNVRRFLNESRTPPVDSVRIEEMINYFSYNYPEPVTKHPFSVNTEMATTPWNSKTKLLHIGLKGKNIDKNEIPPRNLVFLLDVSGSMFSSDKLPLLKKSIKMLVNQLTEKDTVSIVVYAGAAGAVLEPTEGSNKQKILAAIEKLSAGGSTNGGQGIQLAYKFARQHYRKDGINRVILGTDGDFNVGVSDQGSLIRMIEKERESGVFLTVLGFGRGNLNDSMMEKLADKGNGNFAYIDTIAEAKKVLVQQAGSTLIAIAKDVKFQVEFNPAKVSSYRLIGYENRRLNNEDFNDDTKDAGDIGAGHTVTVLYELVLAGTENDSVKPKVDELKYQNERTNSNAASSDELLTVKIRYKHPDAKKSILMTRPVKQSEIKDVGSENFRFSASVATLGMLLRDSKYKGSASYDMAFKMAKSAIGEDPQGYRSEFLRLVRMAEGLKEQ